MRDIYQEVTEQIVKQLERGVRPWTRPWDPDAKMEPVLPLRHNGEPYRGVNIVLLWSAAGDRGYAAPTWMTFNQARKLGGGVRKGEKGVRIAFAKTLSKTEIDPRTGLEEEREVRIMRGYTVFNVQQIAGLPEKYYETPSAGLSQADRNAAAEEFVRLTGAEVRHGGDKAYYSPSGDYVQLPAYEAFRSPEGYYATLTHELTHWTRAPERLDRNFGQKRFGDKGYAMEELVAEIGSAFLAAELGITPEVREDHTAYIHAWLQVMADDKKAFFTAAGHAGKAAAYLGELAQGWRTGLNAAEAAPRPERYAVSIGDEIIDGDRLRWTEEVRTGAWAKRSVSGIRTIEAEVLKVAAEGRETRFRLAVMAAQGVDPPQAGERISRAGSALVAVRCDRAAWDDEGVRNAAVAAARRAASVGTERQASFSW